MSLFAFFTRRRAAPTERNPARELANIGHTKRRNKIIATANEIAVAHGLPTIPLRVAK